MKGLTAIATICGYLLAGPALAGPEIKPGQWDYTMTSEIQGMPVKAAPMTMKFSSCVRNKEPVIETEDMKKAKCRVMNKKESGDTVSYTMRCESGNMVMDTSYRLKVSANTIDGSFEQTHKMDGQTRGSIKGTLVGKRAGACKAK